MTHDESSYKDPQTFEPQRFLDQAEIASPATTSISYGFGRRYAYIYISIDPNYLLFDRSSIRVCPGRELADASLWTTAAFTLATVNIGKPFGADGKELKPADVAYTSTMIRWGGLFTKHHFRASLIDRNLQSSTTFQMPDETPLYGCKGDVGEEGCWVRRHGGINQARHRS